MLGCRVNRSDGCQGPIAFDPFVAKLGALTEAESDHSRTDLLVTATAAARIRCAGKQLEVVWAQVFGDWESRRCWGRLSRTPVRHGLARPRRP